ncbi:MAG: GxxExxY protein [Candidatus Paceibacterota bacterium]|jgi:GxxExxY protein
MGEKIIQKELSYKICGLCFKTQNELGRFRSERTYADYIEKLLTINNIPFKREETVGSFIEEKVNRRNIPDFIIDNKILLDLKAKDLVTRDDYHQMKRYLTASNLKLGLIVNFRQEHISLKRVLNPYS